MNPRKPAGAAGLLILLLTVSAGAGHAAGSSSQVPFLQSTFILVTDDGNAIVNETLSMPQNTTSITVPMLSAEVGNIVAVDQSGLSASYEIGNDNITIYTLGDTRVYLAYTTDALTTKQGAVWTLDYSWNSSSTLELPYESTILSLSDAPISVSEQDGSPVLALGPGSWEIGYGLPIVTTQTQTSSSARTSSSATLGGSSAASTVSSSPLSSSASAASGSSASSSGAGSGAPQGAAPLALVALAAAAGAAAALLVWRRRRGGRRPGGADPSSLRPDDVEMLRFIRDRGGRVVETEIRERFNAPRTTAWRQAKRLEQLGYVRVKKVGSQNQLELIRDDFERRSPPGR